MKLDIVLPGNPETGDADKDAEARIQPEQIESFNDGYHWGCFVYMKSGQMYLTRLSADDFEKHLISYYQALDMAMRKPIIN